VDKGGLLFEFYFINESGSGYDVYPLIFLGPSGLVFDLFSI